MGAAPSSNNSGGDGELGPIAEINVTPLVDVMLVLLIIFMVTAPLMMSQLPIQLPKPNMSATPPPKDPTVVAVDEAGNYSLDEGRGAGPQPYAYDGLQVKLQEMAKADPNEIIFIKAAKKLDYGRVVDLISVVGQSGFDKVSLQQQAPDAP
jgi:biopolymer transport protein ExbD